MCGDASALAFAKDSSRFFFQIPFVFSIFFFGLLIEHFEEGALSPSFSLDRNHTKTNNKKLSLFLFLPFYLTNNEQRTKKKGICIMRSLVLRASRRLLNISERSIATTAKVNAGMGSPTGTAPPPTAPLEEEHELIWDAGDKHPEPALDNLPAKIVGKYEALGMLVGAMCFMGGVYTFAGYYDKAASRPFVERDIEKGLQKELGR